MGEEWAKLNWYTGIEATIIWVNLVLLLFEVKVKDHPQLMNECQNDNGVCRAGFDFAQVCSIHMLFFTNPHAISDK